MSAFSDKLSIRGRVVAACGALLIPMAFFALSWFPGQQAAAVRHALELQTKGLATALAAASGPAVAAAEAEPLKAMLDQATKGSEIGAVVVSGAGAKVLARRGPSQLVEALQRAGTGWSGAGAYVRSSVAVRHEGREIGQLSLAVSTKSVVAARKDARTDGLVVCLLFVVAGVLVAVWTGQATAARLRARVAEITAVAQGLVAGDMSRRVSDGSDELAKAGDALNQVSDVLATAVGNVARSAEELRGSAAAIDGVSGDMATRADSAVGRAIEVSQAAEDNSERASAAATAVQQMGHSIREIARNTTDAVRVVDEAMAATTHASERIEQLGSSSQDVGNVSALISDIAAQTNLLALNASIEAARAGDAGRGFAVVANEVKELANATGRAAGEIGELIEAIQRDAGLAVDAIQGICRIMDSVNSYQQGIAVSVEEQERVTREIGTNVSDAAQANQGIAGGITSVAEAARETATSATQARQAAARLASVAGQLDQFVGRFRA